jgi:Endosomal/lysosomal potassium channel TMEM175
MTQERGIPGHSRRKHEVSRVEGFSDAVFGFALTLLVVSLEVPTSFAQLIQTMQGFLAFGICFALIVWIWYEHYTFFRRFGLTDARTVFLNAVLLFVVLFYVYPLKFVFTGLVRALTGWGPAIDLGLTPGDGRTLMVAYSLGFVVVFGALGSLYLHAWKMRGELGLDPLETFDAKAGLIRHLWTAAVGVVSIGLALVLPPRGTQWAGWIYGLLGPLHGIVGARLARQRRALERESSVAASGPRAGG